MTCSGNITRSVHVQAMGFAGRPSAETEWLRQQADVNGFPQGNVAPADLADPQRLYFGIAQRLCRL